MTNKIFFICLILGCIASALGGRYDVYEFHDSHGRCWRCTSGNDCVRCSNSIKPSNFPTTWDRSCPSPTNCAQYPGAKFPHPDISRYYLCAVNQVVTVSCFCERVFDMRTQSCVFSDELSSLGCSPYTVTEPRACS